MGKYIKKFENHADYESWKNSAEFVTPNLCLCHNEHEVHMEKKRPSPFNGYEYVDLGLPSGALWAKCNVGATTEEGYGGYYAWGETSEKSDCSWSTYAFGDGSNASNLTKYNSTDGKTVLEPEDDVCHVIMGGSWQMPTLADIQELTVNTTNAWVTVNGVNGRRFTSNTDASKSIFIPAAGYRDGASVSSAGSACGLWSSSLGSSSVQRARELDFGSSSILIGDLKRYYGFSVRGVVKP